MSRFVAPVAETMSVEELRKYRKQVHTKEIYSVGLRQIFKRYSLLFLYRALSVLGVPFESFVAFWLTTSKLYQHSQMFLYKVFFGVWGRLQGRVQFKSSGVTNYISSNYFTLRYWHLSVGMLLYAAAVIELVKFFLFFSLRSSCTVYA